MDTRLRRGATLAAVSVAAAALAVTGMAAVGSSAGPAAKANYELLASEVKKTLDQQ